MTREIYEAMRRRISITDLDNDGREYYELMGWPVPKNATFYLFNADGLNEGVDNVEDEAFSIRQPMYTRNMWNVCQRFYSYIKNLEKIDKRLLAL